MKEIISGMYEDGGNIVVFRGKIEINKKGKFSGGIVFEEQSRMKSEIEKGEIIGEMIRFQTKHLQPETAIVVYELSKNGDLGYLGSWRMISSNSDSSTTTLRFGKAKLFIGERKNVINKIEIV
jgi:hypothetical protein